MYKRVANLRILGVREAGDHSRERVVLRARRPCNIGRYAIIDTTYQDPETISNLNRHFYWLPDLDVDTNDLIVLYTRTGPDRTVKSKHGYKIHKLHWGFDEDVTVWNRDEDAVTVVRISALQARPVRAPSGVASALARATAKP